MNITLTEILIVIGLAAIISAVFFFVFRTSGPWGKFWTLLLTLALAGIAAEEWIKPFGPEVYGVAWIPTVFVIVLFATFIIAVTPSHRIRGKEIPSPTGEDTGKVVLSAFFWFFIIFLLFAAVVGLFTRF
jgi:hypothetical protein